MLSRLLLVAGLVVGGAVLVPAVPDAPPSPTPVGVPIEGTNARLMDPTAPPPPPVGSD